MIIEMIQNDVDLVIKSNWSYNNDSILSYCALFTSLIFLIWSSEKN